VKAITDREKADLLLVDRNYWYFRCQSAENALLSLATFPDGGQQKIVDTDIVGDEVEKVCPECKNETTTMYRWLDENKDFNHACKNCMDHIRWGV
jgi:hypothetical protein